MEQRPRARLIVPLTASTRPPTRAAHARHPARSDLASLAALMLEAYRGTIDDAGESLTDALDEVTNYLNNPATPPRLDCSFLAHDGDTPVSACLISIHAGEPLIAYVFTAPHAKGQGLATALIESSMHTLATRGFARLALWVTIGNAPAERVYEKLGFRRDAD